MGLWVGAPGNGHMELENLEGLDLDLRLHLNHGTWWSGEFGTLKCEELGTFGGTLQCMPSLDLYLYLGARSET